jgi:hypothetical protein
MTNSRPGSQEFLLNQEINRARHDQEAASISGGHDYDFGVDLFLDHILDRHQGARQRAWATAARSLVPDGQTLVGQLDDLEPTTVAGKIWPDPLAAAAIAPPTAAAAPLPAPFAEIAGSAARIGTASSGRISSHSASSVFSTVTILSMKNTDTTLPTPKIERASSLPAASAADLNEWEVPCDTGSFKMNFTAFGFGVSCISAIFGISRTSLRGLRIYRMLNPYIFVNIKNYLIEVLRLEGFRYIERVISLVIRQITPKETLGAPQLVYGTVQVSQQTRSIR